MLSIHADTALFAIPGGAGGSDELETILARVLWLSKERAKNPNRVTHAVGAIETLQMRNQYPYFAVISEWLEICGLKHAYDARDMATVFGTLLTRTKTFEALHQYEVTECGHGTISPQLPQPIDPSLLPISMSAFATVAALDGSRNDVQGLLCSGIIGAGGGYSGVFTNCQIVGIEDARPQADPIVGPIICVGPDTAWTDFLDAEAIWCRSTSDGMTHLAVWLRALAIRKAANLDGPPADFYVGTNFRSSLQGNQCCGGGQYASAALEACARLVSGLPKDDADPFNKVRDGDGAKALRIHLTKKGVGLRLMVWERGSRMELANIGPKHELEIAAGDPDSAFHTTYHC